jgi:hypothetical protein
MEGSAAKVQEDTESPVSANHCVISRVKSSVSPGSFCGKESVVPSGITKGKKTVLEKLMLCDMKTIQYNMRCGPS